MEPLGPEMTARFGVDELHINAHAVSPALDAALKDIANVQLAPDRFRVGLPALVSERRIAGDKGKRPRIRERSVVRLAVSPSTKCSCSGSPPILANGRTTIERRGEAEFSDTEAGADFAPAGSPTTSE